MKGWPANWAAAAPGRASSNEQVIAMLFMMFQPISA
jgi:hypothetical protein